MAAPTQSRHHLVTAALEDYFQVGAFHSLIQMGQWDRFESRLGVNAERVLALLERSGVHATFFVSGWTAARYPEIIRMVADCGHEIASQGYYHRSIQEMSPAEFRDDLRRAREALERASRTRVLGYRVAHRWFRPEDLWALDVLVEEGYRYDSSIGPLFRRFAREPWRRFAHLHRHGSEFLWEFPISTLGILGWAIPIAGGNYFRQFPHLLLRRCVARWIKRYDFPFVMYFNVWELDPEQPAIAARSRLTRIRHYRNLGKLSWVLEDYFKRYRFVSVARYLALESSPADGLLPETPDPDRSSIAIRDTAADNRVAAPLPGFLSRQPVTVIVPCYNEELILPYLANTLRSMAAQLSSHYEFNFVFVNDGSRDGTAAALRRIFGNWPGCVFVDHERNLGVAAAIRTGMQSASTETVCSIDCDCTYDPHELGAMIPLLVDGVDMVTASPYHPSGRVRNVPPWRLRLSKGASFLYRRILHQKLHTYTSCFRVYRRSAVIGLEARENGFLGIAEMLAMLDLRGGRIVEYPTTLEVRLLGRSKMKLAWTILGHLRILARVCLLRVIRRGRLSGSELSGSDVLAMRER